MKKLPEKMPLTNIVNIPEVVEVCANCMNEVHIFWNTAEDGYKAFCPYCGERLMLCDECRHSELDKHGNACGVCDYDSETDTCKHNRKIPDFSVLSEQELRKFGADIFRSMTGQNCNSADVLPQECDRRHYWFIVGSLYIMFRQIKNTGLWETVLTDPDGNELMLC